MLRHNLKEFITKLLLTCPNHPYQLSTLLTSKCFAVLLMLVMVLQTPAIVWAGLCREAQLCCNGRDSSCVVQKAPINAIIEDLSDKPCYCDHACLKLGDCCEDFKDHCGVLDCQVSDWGQWSECDASCGTGIMLRTRTIVQAPQNGGKHCPTLMQKRGCQGFRCHGHRERKILRETALLLPAALSHNRHMNDSHDIRRNLRLRYHDAYKHNRELEYCVEFEVLKSSKACHKLPPYNLMIEGDRITVRCDLEAFVYETNNNNNNPITINKTRGATNTHLSSELSNNSNQDDEDNNSWEEDDTENFVDNSSSDERDYYDSNYNVNRKFTTTTKRTLPATTTTTTTTTTSSVALTHYHCRGEGLPGRTTRWSALAAPSCRGKWLRLTVGVPKTCTKAQFIFV